MKPQIYYSRNWLTHLSTNKSLTCTLSLQNITNVINLAGTQSVIRPKMEFFFQFVTISYLISLWAENEVAYYYC